MKRALSVKLRIPELRAKLNRMSQRELARRAELSAATISNLESTKAVRIELATIAKLCSALECTPGDLFEMPSQSESEILNRQKQALKSVLGMLEFDKSISSEQVDNDLADLAMKRKKPNERGKKSPA